MTTIVSGNLVRYRTQTNIIKIGKIAYIKDDCGKLKYVLDNKESVDYLNIIAFGTLIDVLRPGDLLITNYGGVKKVEDVSIGNVIYTYPDHAIRKDSDELNYIDAVLTNEQVSLYAFRRNA